MSIEAVLVLPLVLFGMLFVYSSFSAFQQKSTANKAAYTIADYISRQTEPVDSSFIKGMADIYGFLNRQSRKKIRVSSILWSDADGGKYKLQWSKSSDGGDPALTGSTLDMIEPRLPVMPAGATVLVVETSTRWNPIFNVGLEAVDFQDIVITKPRFATQVLFEE